MSSADPRPLPGGLVLRTMEPADLEQVGALLTERGEPDDAVDHRLVVSDPDAGPSSCAVVVDGDRVVSTATLLDEQVRVGRAGSAGAVTLPAGQVELVATDTAYEGRGLVRALMGWAHERSAERGHLLGVMVGIPYFYRLFGYEYAITIPPAPELTGVPDAPGTGTLRPATEADLPAIVRLQDAAQAGVDVAVPHSVPRWRWLLARDGTTVWVVERDGEVVATGRATDPDEGVLLAEAAAVDRAAAADLVAGLAATAGDDPLQVQRRPGAGRRGLRLPVRRAVAAGRAVLRAAAGPGRRPRRPAPGAVGAPRGERPGPLGPRPGDLDLRRPLPDAVAGERVRPGAGGWRDAGAGLREGPRLRARLPGRAAARPARHGRAQAGAGRTSTPAATPSGSRRCSRPCRRTC